MSEPVENTALVELLAGISDRRIRRKVQKLLQFGAEAVRSLGDLDSALYLRANGEDQLQIVSDAILSHVRRLLEYLGSIATPKVDEQPVSTEVEFDFSVGDSSASEPGKEAAPASGLQEAAIGASVVATDEDNWRALTEEMDTLQYGLGSELRELDRRFSVALKNERKQQALRDLNDATNSLMDGVFAVMTTVYERFLGHADPERMIPGHRDTLGKALAVRRSVAELRREVQELNRAIQDSGSSSMVVEMSYKLVVQSLMEFINADVFAYLRAGDRQEFSRFGDSLVQGDAAKNRLACEGLDKYLDSLAVVSQRDVLLKHDADLRIKIGGELDRALAPGAVRPQEIPEAINQAFVKADRLFGLIDELDTLVFKWSALDEEKRADPVEALAMGRKLRDLVDVPKAAAPPTGDGFF